MFFNANHNLEFLVVVYGPQEFNSFLTKNIGIGLHGIEPQKFALKINMDGLHYPIFCLSLVPKDFAYL